VEDCGVALFTGCKEEVERMRRVSIWLTLSEFCCAMLAGRGIQARIGET
jgi:hypothetical protein